MERSHQRHRRTPAFNLVSLMDIFTILVFFLLVNSSDGEVLPSTRSVELPESVAEQKPRQNVVVMITERDILVQGNAVARVSDVVGSAGSNIKALQQALESQDHRRLLPTSSEASPAPEVTIMGNKNIPYALLKKVMTTCTDAGYGRISLAVMQKAVQES
ncbi:MAG: biopolymer transporter ExbD [Thiogranum sp.]|nr:biopolymer transporter ExbD [Thiogranum sp.]